jgi:hypothetical protein
MLRQLIHLRDPFITPINILQVRAPLESICEASLPTTPDCQKPSVILYILSRCAKIPS